MQITNQDLNEIRKNGYRPGVVACITTNKKLLMFYKNEHKLWQLPQGRIDPKEEINQALKRNLEEELGEEFVKNLDFDTVEIVDSDEMEFKPGSHELSPLLDEEGKEIPMIGKKYFFCLIKSKTENFDIKKTKFDQHFWLSFREAYFLADKMYQRGKRRITLKIINRLNELGLII